MVRFCTTQALGRPFYRSGLFLDDWRWHWATAHRLHTPARIGHPIPRSEPSPQFDAFHDRAGGLRQASGQHMVLQDPPASLGLASLGRSQRRDTVDRLYGAVVRLRAPSAASDPQVSRFYSGHEAPENGCMSQQMSTQDCPLYR